MFNDSLFLKSLKPTINLSDRKSRSFLDRHKEKFKPTKERDVQFYNSDIIKSKYNRELKFTNYISFKTSSLITIRLDELSRDLKLIRNLPPSEVNFNKKRITELIKMYVEEFNPDELSDDQVMKVSLSDSFGKKEGVRVYFLLNVPLNVYEILLIDPFHLVIPSKHFDKKGKLIQKDKMLNTTFNQNQNNNQCISSYFKLEE